MSIIDFEDLVWKILFGGWSFTKAKVTRKTCSSKIYFMYSILLRS